MLEKQWTKLREEKREAIAKNTEAISKIDTSKFEKEVEEKKNKTRKNKYHCTKCEYKTNFLHELEVHKSMIHRSKIMEKKGKRTFYDSDGNEGGKKRPKDLAGHANQGQGLIAAIAPSQGQTAVTRTPVPASSTERPSL